LRPNIVLRCESPGAVKAALEQYGNWATVSEQRGGRFSNCQVQRG
jgi:hypothetical protein